MKKHTITLTALILSTLILSSPLHAEEEGTPKKFELTPGKIQKRTYEFKDAMKEMEYALFVPKGYQQTKKYPLIVALHGLGSNPMQIIRYPGFATLAQKFGYVIVAPMGYNSGGWYGQLPSKISKLSEKDVMNVLEMTRKELSIDPNRIFLMGHSMGGGGTWHLGLKYPKLWAGLAPIAPAIYLRKPRDLKTITHLPVILIQGDKDTLVPVKKARQWAEKMKELKMKHKYVEVKGGGHIMPAIQRLPDIFEFFNEHKRTSK